MVDTEHLSNESLESHSRHGSHLATKEAPGAGDEEGGRKAVDAVG